MLHDFDTLFFYIAVEKMNRQRVYSLMLGLR